MDLVSVIVPCYNVSSFVDKLSWIFDQTYSNLEIILVDDCSTDDTLQKLQAFKQLHADKRIIIAHNEKNLGLAATRNRGFELSSGQYLCSWDPDDKAYPQFVDKMLTKLKQEQADFVYCAYDTLNNKGSGQHHLIPNYLLDIQDDIDLLKQQVFRFKAPVWIKMVRRDFIQEHNIKFPLIVLHEDDCWTTQLVLNAKKISFINEPYYQYYTGNTSSITNTYKSNDKREKGYWQLMYFNINYINKLNLASLMFDEWNTYFLYYLLNRYQFIVPTNKQDRFFIKVRDFCQQNNVALTSKELSFKHRLPLYLLLPNIGGFAKKREKLKMAYFSGKKMLVAINRVSALIKDAEANLQEYSE